MTSLDEFFLFYSSIFCEKDNRYESDENDRDGDEWLALKFELKGSFDESFPLFGRRPLRIVIYFVVGRAAQVMKPLPVPSDGKSHRTPNAQILPNTTVVPVKRRVEG